MYESGVKGFQSNKPQLIENVVMRKNKKISDAGGATAIVHEIIKISDMVDIQESVKKAKQEGKAINMGGRRHSMGGQTLSDQAIFLNMLNFNGVTYDTDTKTITAQAGATWKKFKKF